MATKLWKDFKSAVAKPFLSSDSSRDNPEGTIADEQPMAIETAKISADLKTIIQQGSLGTIYAGIYKGETCAVKLFNSEIVLKEVLPERGIASVIQHHPNVVLVHGLWYGSTANVLPNKDCALVMEMCSSNLDAYLKQRVARSEVAVFRLENRLDILIGVASGMTHLHSKGIVHGNLCAKKVLLNFSGPSGSHDQKITAKVADVNEMKLFTSDTVLQLKVKIQKSSIMPPEVKDGGDDMELTQPVDLFSFGCLVAHVASCVFPEQDTKDTQSGLNEFQRLAQCLKESRHPDIYKPLMQRCLAEDPTVRGTFEDVMKDLSVHQSSHGHAQVQKFEEQILQTEHLQADTPSVGSPRSSAELYSDKFLPNDSVVVNDPTIKANMLGKGSLAKVYRGTYNGKLCAVKIFKEGTLKRELSPDPGDDLPLLIPKLQHTNIVQVFGMWCGTHKKKVALAIVMELCSESLMDYVKNYKGKLVLGSKRKLAILKDIAKGMSYLHEQDIIHGNLHTGNVLLCPVGDVTVTKVADFGMARYIDSDRQSSLTTKFKDEEIFPPEVFDHKECKTLRLTLLTTKVDVFCFGELALEVACGSYPIPDKKQKGRNELLTEVQRREKHLSSLKQSEKEPLGLIIRKCLADVPEGRPSFTDILRVVEKHLQKFPKQPDVEELQNKPVCKLGPTQPHPQGMNVKLSLESSDITADYNITVGKGSFAIVYQGMYRNKECAIKVFKTGIVRMDTESQLQLLSIVQHHPNVVLVHGLWCGSTTNQLPGNQPALVTELCSTSLSKYLKEKIDGGVDESFKLNSKVDILRDVAAGMLYLHSVQIVHGNLTGNTVLLNVRKSDVIAKVTGFGLSRLLNPDTVHHMTTLHRKSGILPSEVKDGDTPVNLTGAADVFSFGCLILHVATCHCPDLQTDPLDSMSEFKKRAHLISDEESHVFHPLMEKCWAERPQDRVTFAEVILHLRKYSKRKQLLATEEENVMQEIEKLKSHLLQLQRSHDNLKEEKEKLLLDMETLHEQHNKNVKESSLHVHDKLQSQSEVERLKNEVQTLQQEIGGVKGQQCVVENQKQTANRSIAELKNQLETLKRTSETTETELRGRLAKSQQQLTKEREMAVTQREMDEKRGHEHVAELEKQLAQARTRMDKLERERNAAVSDKEQTKRDLEQLRAQLAGEIEQLRARTATGDKTIASHQKKLKEAQEKEQSLNADLRQYRDNLKAMEDARDKLEGSKQTLEDAKAALVKQVRELTFTLKIRAEDLDEKEKRVTTLLKDLGRAQKAIEEGNALEPVLRQNIDDLEANKKELTNELEKMADKLRDVEKDLIEAKKANVTLESERDKKIKAIRELEDEYDTLNFTVQELENALSEMTGCNEELKGQCDKEAESCRLAKEANIIAIKREEDLHGQLTKLHRDHDTLRKAHTVQLQEKMKYKERMKENEEQKKAELQATREDLHKTREELKLLQGSLLTASSELEAKQAERRRLIDELTTMTQNLGMKQEELDASENACLEQQQHNKELQDECAELEIDKKELQSELRNLAAQNEVLQRQLEKETENCHFKENECKRLACSMQELEINMTEMITRNEDLEKRLNDEARKYHETERERNSALEQAETLKKELNEMHMANENLRRKLNLNLPRKMDHIRELTEREEHMKTELATTVKELDCSSLKLEALRKESETLSQNLRESQEELNVSETKCDRLVLSIEELEGKLTDIAARNEELEEQCNEEAENCRILKGERDRQAFSIHKLETELHEKMALNVELRRYLDEEAAKCRLIDIEKEGAVERAERLQKEFNELNIAFEALRKAHILDLQRKTELQGTTEELNRTRLELELLQASLHTASLELEAKERERKSIENDLSAKQEELHASANVQLGLRQHIEELQSNYDRLKSGTEELQYKSREMVAHIEEVEGQRDEEAEKKRILKDECGRLAVTIQEMEQRLSQMTVHTEELEGQRSVEEKRRQLTEIEKEGAVERVEKLQKQYNELNTAHETLRKAHVLDLQRKTELHATTEELNKTRVELELLQASLHTASLELEAKEREKRSIENDLRAKQEELHASTNAQLGLRQHIEESQVSLEAASYEKVQTELQATREALDKTRVELELLQASFHTASLELEAKEREKRSIEDDLRAKEEELHASANAQLGLRQHIEELQSECDRLKSGTEELEYKTREMVARIEEMEGQRDEQAENRQILKDECGRLAVIIQEMENNLSQMTVHTEELEEQRNVEEKRRQLTEIEKEGAVEREEKLQKQFNELNIVHEAVRKAHTLDLQRKTELQATTEELNKARVELELLQASLHTASLELEAKERERRSIENDLRAMIQCLNAKQEELDASVNTQLTLRQHIAELQAKCDKLESNTKELESELSKMSAHIEELEEQCAEETEKCQRVKSERDDQALSINELQTEVHDSRALNEGLKRHLDEEAETCHQLEITRDTAIRRAEELQKQYNELNKDLDKLRKGQVLDRHKKTDFIEELIKREQKNKADLDSADRDYQTLKDKFDAMAEDGIITKWSLNKASSELEAKKKELTIAEEHLKATMQCLKAKEKECFDFEHAQLGLQQHIEELQGEKQQLITKVMQLRAEAAEAEVEKNALLHQLRDFASTKAENTALKTDAEEQAVRIRRSKKKAKQLAEFDKHLNSKQLELAEREKHLDRKQMELATERRGVMELWSKLDREFVSKKNLKSTVKQSVQESFTERGGRLLNASSIEASGTGELVNRHSERKIRDIEDIKQELEEALEQKEREIVLLQQQLDIAKQEVVQQKEEVRAANRKVLECTSKTDMLAKCYFQSHQYPPFLYQLHQKGLPSSGVDSTFELCNAGTIEISEVVHLRLFHPDVSWCDEIHLLLDNLRAMPNKDRQACVSISFLHCGGVTTFYRFRVVLVSQVLSREPEIHPLQLEGGAIPKAMLVYAHAQLNIKNLKKEFGIKAHAKGILFSPQFKGDIPKLAMRLEEMQLEDIPRGLEGTERYLDAIILHQLQRRYKEFATPRILPTVPPMGVAMAVI